MSETAATRQYTRCAGAVLPRSRVQRDACGWTWPSFRVVVDPAFLDWREVAGILVHPQQTV